MYVYRVVHCLYSLLTYYFGTYLGYLDIGEMTISVVHAALVVLNFRFAEWVYDNIVSEGFKHNQRFLHETFKKIRKIFETTVYAWFKTIRDIFLSLILGLLPSLPNFIKMPLEFVGITSKLEKYLDKEEYREI